MAPALAKKAETSTTLLEAAKKVLRQNGYSGLSTRDVAAAAGVPLSQIHYHFGSKQGMVLALFEYLNAQLLDRQNALFGDSTRATISMTTSPPATCALCRNWSPRVGPMPRSRKSSASASMNGATS